MNKELRSRQGVECFPFFVLHDEVCHCDTAVTSLQSSSWKEPSRFQNFEMLRIFTYFTLVGVKIAFSVYLTNQTDICQIFSLAWFFRTVV